MENIRDVFEKQYFEQLTTVYNEILAENPWADFFNEYNILLPQNMEQDIETNLEEEYAEFMSAYSNNDKVSGDAVKDFLDEKLRENRAYWRRVTLNFVHIGEERLITDIVTMIRNRYADNVVPELIRDRIIAYVENKRISVKNVYDASKDEGLVDGLYVKLGLADFDKKQNNYSEISKKVLDEALLNELTPNELEVYRILRTSPTIQSKLNTYSIYLTTLAENESNALSTLSGKQFEKLINTIIKEYSVVESIFEIFFDVPYTTFIFNAKEKLALSLEESGKVNSKWADKINNDIMDVINYLPDKEVIAWKYGKITLNEIIPTFNQTEDKVEEVKAIILPHIRDILRKNLLEILTREIFAKGKLVMNMAFAHFRNDEYEGKINAYLDGEQGILCSLYMEEHPNLSEVRELVGFDDFVKNELADQSKYIFDSIIGVNSIEKEIDEKVTQLAQQLYILDSSKNWLTVLPLQLPTNNTLADMFIDFCVNDTDVAEDIVQIFEK